MTLDDSARPAPSGARASAHSRWLAGLWDSTWPGARPIAHELRTNERWLRFHSLPGSKRYPDDEAEYAELLRRHRAVLEELAARSEPPSREVLLITCSWSSTSQPVPRAAAVAGTSPNAQYWQSFGEHDDPEAWTHLYFELTTLDNPNLEQLLRLVADDQTADVLLAAEDLGWLYHPYDGGADVYPVTLEHRDELRHRHRDWLSWTESGL